MRSFDGVRVGDVLPDISRVVTREGIGAYADASGDHNPLHGDDDAARAAGFGGVIAHGMLTMGHLASVIVEWAGDGAALAALRVQFRAPVFAGETITVGGRVTALDAERRIATLDVWVSVERDGALEWPIRRSEAEVRLA